MAATHFTSVSSLTGSTQILKNPSLPACGLSSSSFLSTFHSSKGTSIRLTLNTRKKIGLSIRAQEDTLQEETQNKGMSRQMGGQWLSSVTRHVRIYAGYIDPVTEAFDQTQTDKLTLILDPTNEFVWPEDKCQKVYDYFSELVDHYESSDGNSITFDTIKCGTGRWVDMSQGAPLTEYTLRLIGSDVEHYIRKLLLDGEIKYNLNARVLNFSMGKPRINMDEMDVSMTEDAN